MMENPLGWRFQPQDYELLRFLFDFVTGRSSVDDEGLIHKEDIFGDKEPWELIPYGPSKKKVYFFTRLKKKGKSMTGSRVERTVGKKVMNGKRSGNWHGQDKGKPVVDEKGKIVMGYKRSFIYKNQIEPEQDGKWLLKEFYLPETIINKVRAKYPIVEERKDFVLCRLQRKKDNNEETFEQGTSGNGFEGVPVPVPVETLPPADGGSPNYIISTSYFDAVPVETTTTLQIAEDDLMQTFPPADGSHLDIVPVETTTTTTLQIAEGDPLFPPAPAPAPAGDAADDDDDDIASYFDGVPVEILPEEADSFQTPNDDEFSRLADLIWNSEDVTKLIDFS